ncbi:MAG: prepilin peptidase [Clostridia bacterium]|nr:prepilin peptidase [Clostridia bacterium]
MELFYLIVTYVLVGLFGLCVGSFLNVVIYRVPNGMSIAKPNSHCPNCKYELRWYDNIPILSYLILGGKCRSCKTHISFRYTAVEIANTLLWLLCTLLFWEKSIPLAVIYMLTLSVFICVFFIDLEHKIVFDRFQIILLILAICSIFFDKEYGWISHIIGGVSGFAVFYLISWLFEKMSGKEGLGGGDVKLTGAVGLLLGWERLLLALLIATIPAAVIMLIVNRIRSKSAEENEEMTDEQEKGQYPFAPFLVFGFSVAMFFGKTIIDWYLSILGL